MTLTLLSTGYKENRTLFVGGFTKGDRKGLSVFKFKKRTGDLQLISENNAGPKPSYFCFSNKHNLIYVLNEVMKFKGKSGGGLTTLKYNSKNGQFLKINEILIPHAGPCYISLSADNDYLFVTSYPKGSVTAIKLDIKGLPESITDQILYVKDKPESSHAHMILHDPLGRYVYVTDLGLDRILIYDFDPGTGKLNLNKNGFISLPKGSGPRHFVFNSDGSKLYVINELGSTIMVFDVGEKERLKLVQILPTVKEGFEGKNYCADIHTVDYGKFLYGSNRGENSIVVFKIEEGGLLTLSGHVTCGGDWPRSFVIDPSGKFLLVGNQKSNEISIFKINRKTGIPEGPVKKVGINMPVCLKFWV
jgi:6-phosphogluconolactonase